MLRRGGPIISEIVVKEREKQPVISAVASCLSETGLVPQPHVVTSIRQVIAGHLQPWTITFSALHISTEPFCLYLQEVGVNLPEKMTTSNDTKVAFQFLLRVNKGHHFGLWRVGNQNQWAGARLTAKQLTVAEKWSEEAQSSEGR